MEKMNLKINPTKDQLSQLFAHCSYETHHFLWVEYNGNVNLTSSKEEFKLEKWNDKLFKFMFKFRSEDNGCSLRIAAENTNFIDRIFCCLTQKWAAGVEGVIGSL